MIKRTIEPPRSDLAAARSEPEWIRLDELAEVEITSETEGHPIEAALLPGDERGWEADTPGSQIIRVLFATPRPLKRLRLVFEENARERTQQFMVRAAAALDGGWRDLVRQQFNFSPGGATREQEDYTVNLPVVAALELTIVPDIRGGNVRATLQQLRVA